jgi:hypothetical protein
MNWELFAEGLLLFTLGALCATIVSLWLWSNDKKREAKRWENARKSIEVMYETIDEYEKVITEYELVIKMMGSRWN